MCLSAGGCPSVSARAADFLPADFFRRPPLPPPVSAPLVSSRTSAGRPPAAVPAANDEEGAGLRPREAGWATGGKLTVDGGRQRAGKGRSRPRRRAPAAAGDGGGGLLVSAGDCAGLEVWGPQARGLLGLLLVLDRVPVIVLPLTAGAIASAYFCWRRCLAAASHGVRSAGDRYSVKGRGRPKRGWEPPLMRAMCSRAVRFVLW
jgi:hypothetical protein